MDPRNQQLPKKEHVVDDLARPGESAAAKYRRIFVGRDGLVPLLRYELAAMLARAIPGALGYLLRKWLYPALLKRAGAGIQWGRNVVLRHPGKIVIGARTAIDDDCLLCARGAGEDGFVIGSDVLVARSSIVLVKSGFVAIGDETVVGSQTFIGSAGGIRIGKAVGIGGQCYIGGGRYETDRADVPIQDHDMYTKGPVEIGDGCSIGMGVRILDGVKIGRGSLIGAGSIVREDIPEFTVVTPHQRLVLLKRETTDA